jgi:transposase, IS5 family
VQLEQRLGEDQPVALVQERLPTAHKTGALATKDLERVRELLQIHSTKAIAAQSRTEVRTRAYLSAID